MSDNNFKIDIPFQTRPPRLKDLVNEYVMGDVWIRDTPFGPVTDSLVVAEKFGIKHSNILRAIDRCKNELSIQLKFELNKNLIENSYLAGAKKGKSGKGEKSILQSSDWPFCYFILIVLKHDKSQQKFSIASLFLRLCAWVK